MPYGVLSRAGEGGRGKGVGAKGEAAGGGSGGLDSENKIAGEELIRIALG